MSLSRICDKIRGSLQYPSHPSCLHSVLSSWPLVASSTVLAVHRSLNIKYGPFSDSMWSRQVALTVSLA